MGLNYRYDNLVHFAHFVYFLFKTNLATGEILMKTKKRFAMSQLKYVLVRLYECLPRSLLEALVLCSDERIFLYIPPFLTKLGVSVSVSVAPQRLIFMLLFVKKSFTLFLNYQFDSTIILNNNTLLCINIT